MAYEDLTPEQQSQISYDLWNQYNQPDNSYMAEMLRSYVSPNAQDPTFVGLDQKERLAKLLAQKNYQQPSYQRANNQTQTPSVDANMVGSMMGNSQTFGGSGIFGGPAGQATGTMGTYGDYSQTAGVPASEASSGGLNWGGVEGTANAPVGGYATSSDPGWFGKGGQLGGGWVPAIGGAIAGYSQGAQNYRDDQNMWSGKDGYGKYHKDYRAEVGGGVLGGVLGYYGGPVGAAVAGPVVKAVHPYAEKGTRSVINFGDKVGGAGGALMLDPIGTVSTGKYSWGELGKGALLGPLTKLF